MRWIFLTASIVFAAFAMILGVKTFLRPLHQGLYSTSTVFDHGSVKQGDKQTCSFDLINYYDETVHVVDFVNSCGCSDVVCEPMVIPPGAKARLKVTWNIQRARGLSQVHVSLIHRLHDNNRYVLTFKIRADVLTESIVEPNQIAFAPGEVEKEIEFRPGFDPDVKLVNIISEHQAIRHEPLAELGRYRIVLDRAKWSKDLNKTQLVIETTGRIDPRFAIPIEVQWDESSE
jgi:hypothetical protein